MIVVERPRLGRGVAERQATHPILQVASQNRALGRVVLGIELDAGGR